MRISFRPLQLLALLTIGLLAGCDDDSTGSNTTNVQGAYNVATVAVPQGTTTTNRTIPVVLYEGPATGNGQTYNVRLELLSASISLVDQGSRYTYTGTFRLTETANRFPAETDTFTETGTYIYGDGDISFLESLNSEVHIGANGTLRNGAITVDIVDPVFDDAYSAVFRK